MCLLSARHVFRSFSHCPTRAHSRHGAAFSLACAAQVPCDFVRGIACNALTQASIQASTARKVACTCVCERVQAARNYLLHKCGHETPVAASDCIKEQIGTSLLRINVRAYTYSLIRMCICGYAIRACHQHTPKHTPC